MRSAAWQCRGRIDGVKIEQVKSGTWVAVMPAPVTAEALADLAARLPSGAHLSDSDTDHDGTLYTTWEVHRVIPID
jgi:hypothetical protein